MSASEINLLKFERKAWYLIKMMTNSFFNIFRCKYLIVSRTADVSGKRYNLENFSTD